MGEIPPQEARKKRLRKMRRRAVGQVWLSSPHSVMVKPRHGRAKVKMTAGEASLKFPTARATTPALQEQLVPLVEGLAWAGLPVS